MLKIWEQGQYFVGSKFSTVAHRLAFFLFQSDEGLGIVNVWCLDMK
jgi:hypothetical protein